MSNEEIRKVIDECILALSDLLGDLNVSNPTYKRAMDVGNNPVISFVSQVIGRNPLYYAEPVGDPIGTYVRFDIPKIRALQNELEEFKANLKD